MKYAFYLAAGLLLAACQPETETKVQGPFDQVYDFEQLVDSLNETAIGLIKTLEKDGSRETISLDTVDWKKELEPFTSASFNQPKNKDKYTVDSVHVPLAGISRYTYRATSDKLPIQQAEYEYQGNRLWRAYIQLNEENAIHGYSNQLFYERGAGFKLGISQQVTGVLQESIAVEALFTGATRSYTGMMSRADRALPIRLEVEPSDLPVITFLNAAERIRVEPERGNGDTLIYKMPVFLTSLYLVQTDSDTLRGYWLNTSGSAAYRLPFEAYPTNSELDMASFSSRSIDLSGKWEVIFDRGNRVTEAMGLFERYGNRVFGTFLTRSGDYRHLEGRVLADSFYVSGFDGSHMYLFTGRAVPQMQDSISGDWYSGKSFHIPWYAKKNEGYTLPDPDTLTYLQPGFDRFEFTFPDANGTQVSLADERFRGKAVIVTIMGSWCPNCMDEARYLREVYADYNDQGLEIIGLSFERPDESDEAFANIRKMVDDLQIPYTVLWAGKASGKAAAEALPMLNHVISFPTTIYVGRDGSVQKIHTGFRGPGTGSFYTEFVEENRVFIESLLATD